MDREEIQAVHYALEAATANLIAANDAGELLPERTRHDLFEALRAVATAGRAVWDFLEEAHVTDLD